MSKDGKPGKPVVLVVEHGGSVGGKLQMEIGRKVYVCKAGTPGEIQVLLKQHPDAAVVIAPDNLDLSPVHMDRIAKFMEVRRRSRPELPMLILTWKDENKSRFSFSPPLKRAILPNLSLTLLEEISAVPQP